VWLPHNDTILCTTARNYAILVISLSGDVIAQTKNLYPLYLSVSTDEVIYLTTFDGVYQSSDNGLSWCLLIKSQNQAWQYQHAIKVSIDSYTDDIWTLISDGSFYWRLRIYTINSSLSLNMTRCNVKDLIVTWRDVVAPTSAENTFARPVYDGYANVLIADRLKRAVHVWSVTGQYDRRLLSSSGITSLDVVALDKLRHVMYVGQLKGIVAVFNLTYQ
jgi:hypothetical protein